MLSPAKAAATCTEPGSTKLVVHVAVMPLIGCAPQPARGAPPMVKAIVPVALFGETETPNPAGGEIVAVNVTGWPAPAVGADDATARVVGVRGPSPRAIPVHTRFTHNSPTRRAAPDARSISYRADAFPPSEMGAWPSAANATPAAGAFEVPTRIAGAMSNSATAPKSNGLPSNVTGMPAVCVPALAGFWMKSLLLPGSSV
jgi:hypothetical protein